MEKSRIKYALIVVGIIGVLFAILNILFPQLILSIIVWVCLGIFWGIALYDYRQNKQQEYITEKFFIEIPDSGITKLVESEHGKELWDKFVHTQSNIKSNIKIIIAFPIRITYVSTPFIQGFFHKYTTDGKHTWKDIKKYITIIGESHLVEKFNQEINR